MISDERLKALRGRRALESSEWREIDAALDELLAIRERITIEPVVLREANRRTLQGLLEWAVYGDGAQAPKQERRYSEEELRLTALEVELCAPWQSERARDGFKSGWQETMRRLRGEGEDKPTHICTSECPDGVLK